MSTTHIFAARHMRHATLAREHQRHPVVAAPGFARSIPTLLAHKPALASIGADGLVLTSHSAIPQAASTDTDATKTRKDSLDIDTKLHGTVANDTGSSISTSIPSTTVADESDTSSIVSLLSGTVGSIVNNLDAVTKGQKQEHAQANKERVENDLVKNNCTEKLVGMPMARAQQQQVEESASGYAKPEATGTTSSLFQLLQSGEHAKLEEAGPLPLESSKSNAICALTHPVSLPRRVHPLLAPADARPKPSSPSSSSPTRAQKGLIHRLFKFGQSSRTPTPNPSSAQTPAQAPIVAITPTQQPESVPIVSTGAIDKDKDRRASGKGASQRFLSAVTRFLRLPLGGKPRASKSPNESNTSASQTAANRLTSLNLSLVAGLPDLITDSFATVMELGRDAPSVYRHRSMETAMTACRTQYHHATGMRLTNHMAAASPAQVPNLATICNVVTRAYAELGDPLISVHKSRMLLDMAGVFTSFRANNDLSPQPFVSSVTTDELARTLAQDFACPSMAPRRYALEAALKHLSQLHAASTHARKSSLFDLATYWAPALLGNPPTHVGHDVFALMLHSTQQIALLERMITEAPVFLAALAAVDNFNIVDEVEVA